MTALKKILILPVPTLSAHNQLFGEAAMIERPVNRDIWVRFIIRKFSGDRSYPMYSHISRTKLADLVPRAAATLFGENGEDSKDFLAEADRSTIYRLTAEAQRQEEGLKEIQVFAMCSREFYSEERLDGFMDDLTSFDTYVGLDCRNPPFIMRGLFNGTLTGHDKFFKFELPFCYTARAREVDLVFVNNVNKVEDYVKHYHPPTCKEKTTALRFYLHDEGCPSSSSSDSEAETDEESASGGESEKAGENVEGQDSGKQEKEHVGEDDGGHAGQVEERGDTDNVNEEDNGEENESTETLGNSSPRSIPDTDEDLQASNDPFVVYTDSSSDGEDTVTSVLIPRRRKEKDKVMDETCKKRPKLG